MSLVERPASIEDDAISRLTARCLKGKIRDRLSEPSL